MWKKNDAPEPQPAPSHMQPPAAAVPAPPAESERTPQAPRTVAITIGSSVVIKGEVSAREDLTITGRVEGKIEVRDHEVRIGREGQVHAEVAARAVVIDGTVKGNVTATERIELTAEGRVEGDLAAPKVLMADGAEFRGRIDMGKKGTEAARKSA